MNRFRGTRWGWAGALTPATMEARSPRCWIALQDLRHVYGAVFTDQARHRLHRFYWRCATAGIPGADPRRPHHAALGGSVWIAGVTPRDVP